MLRWGSGHFTKRRRRQQCYSSSSTNIGTAGCCHSATSDTDLAFDDLPLLRQHRPVFPRPGLGSRPIPQDGLKHQKQPIAGRVTAKPGVRFPSVTSGRHAYKLVPDIQPYIPILTSHNWHSHTFTQSGIPFGIDLNIHKCAD